jgi:pimeloyl-ACP methyl ester carboxylesterase
MGTPVVRQFYRLYPGKTLALVILDGALQNYFKDTAQADSFIAPLRGTEYQAAAARFVDGILPQTMAAGLRDEIRRTMLATPQHVMVGAMEGMMKDPSIWKPDPIKVPLLLLLASNSAWPDDYEKFVRTLAPQADYRVFNGVSHFLMMEQPDKINLAIEEFLTRNRLLGFH